MWPTDDKPQPRDRIEMSIDDFDESKPKRKKTEPSSPKLEAQRVADQQAIRPFLTKDSETPSKFFKGESKFPDLAKKSDGEYLYHATTIQNLRGILESGLNPKLGGEGGAGDIIAGNVDQMAAKHFKASSAKLVHAADNPTIVNRYSHGYASSADDGVLENAEVVLRFTKKDGDGFVDDPYQKGGAVRSGQTIAPERLEILTTEGWHSLGDAEVRKGLTDRIDEMGIPGRDATPDRAPPTPDLGRGR